MLTETTAKTSLGNAASTVVISYNIRQCNLNAKILYNSVQCSAGRPGGLAVIIINVCHSLSSSPNMMKGHFNCKCAKIRNGINC